MWPGLMRKPYREVCSGTLSGADGLPCNVRDEMQQAMIEEEIIWFAPQRLNELDSHPSIL